MDFSELTDFIETHQQESYRVCKKFFIMAEEDFAQIQEFFEPSWTIFFRGENWRSTQKMWHWHALKMDDHIELHFDRGNLDKNLLFGIPHFIFDVCPYVLYCLLRFGRIKHVR